MLFDKVRTAEKWIAIVEVFFGALFVVSFLTIVVLTNIYAQRMPRQPAPSVGRTIALNPVHRLIVFVSPKEKWRWDVATYAVWGSTALFFSVVPICELQRQRSRVR